MYEQNTLLLKTPEVQSKLINNKICKNNNIKNYFQIIPMTKS